MKRSHPIPNCGRRCTFAPKFSPARQYELAIQDCNEALRQNRFFIVRLAARQHHVAFANTQRRRRSLTLSWRCTLRLLSRESSSERAWFQATCPEASFRNGQQAVKDAKAACSIVAWKDETYRHPGRSVTRKRVISIRLCVMRSSTGYQRHLSKSCQRIRGTSHCFNSTSRFGLNQRVYSAHGCIDTCAALLGCREKCV